MILQILGVVFLILLLAIALLAWKVYRLVRARVNADLTMAMAVLPDQSMELEPSSADDWVERERLDFQQRQLKILGAHHVGYFCVHSGFAIIRLSLWKVKDWAVVALYEAQSSQASAEASFIYEVAGKLNDGSLCITSNAHAAYDSRPAGHRMLFDEADSITDFLKRLKQELTTEGKAIRIADPREFFIECYEDTTEWSWREEQLTSDRTRQRLSSVGVHVTDELMQELVDLGRAYAVEININKVRRKLARNTRMSVAQWEKVRDRLIIVNEKMQLHHLLEAVYEAAGELSDTQEQVLDGFEHSTQELVDPISAFQMLVQSMNLKLRRIAATNHPVKSEVYLPQ
ncbi:hypothetical protein [Marinobacter sp. SS21]|uniref:hypothetical protein n=1 Tax=Marinobacter sp. SS21 TaxID=2979460 RepID=UPI00232E1A5E|nr:hypothetical protein [Marinobacter sp. SS21]MDC0661029.1 hypothetical protein [Marinobacter sp. SS21]